MTGILDRCRVGRCRYTGTRLIRVDLGRYVALYRPGDPVMVSIDGGATWRESLVSAPSISMAVRDAWALAKPMLLARDRAEELRRRAADARERRGLPRELSHRERAERWLARREQSSAGHCGRGRQCSSHRARCMATVAAIVRGWDLEDAEVLAVVGGWDAGNDPPLGERELARMIVDARRSANRRAA